LPDADKFPSEGLGGFGDLAGFDAGGAYIYFSDATLFNNCADSLKIWVKPSFVQIVSMADIVADHGFLSANCTFFRHFLYS